VRVVAVSDKIGTAIDRLCNGVAKYHDNLDYIVCDIHPKKADQQQLDRFTEAAKDADVIDAQYYKSMDMLRERFDWLKNIPTILTHNNPYAIHERDWNDYPIVVANNTVMQAELSHITSSRLEYIPLTVDHKFWQFNIDWKPKDQVIMVANRIEGKKGIREVAIACAELGLKFVLVGAISDLDYYHGIEATGNVEFYEQVSDEQLRDLYYDSLLHVCNSQDNFESGTLPILEAMMCGTPVLTRKVGHVPDLNNGKNMFIYEGDNENVFTIIEAIKDAVSDRDRLKEMREKAWNTAKKFNFERRAYGYQKLYRSLISEKQTVSVIVPVCDKPEITAQCLEAIDNQTYDNIEIILVNDSQEPVSYQSKWPVRVIENYNNDYGLARARNRGIIEATGDILVFCDQRIVMDSKAVEALVNSLQIRTWVYGTKGVKKEFVENFSAVYREDLIKLGMFNERCDKYGAMSQEIRSRAKYNGYKITYIPDAKAVQIGKSSNKHSKKDQITDSKNMLWKMGMEL